MEFVQLLVNGLLLGSVYALIGVGMSMIFGIVGLTNLAHGEFVVLGAYASTLLASALGVDPLLTLIVTVPCMFIVGYLLQSSLINRAMKRGAEPALIVTFGISIILQDGMLLLLSADAQHATTSYGVATLHIAGLDISLLNVVICIVSLACIGALTFFLKKTYIGRAIRAVSDDQDAARLSGINVGRVFAIAMGVAMATAAVAGVCVGMRWTFYPSSGGQYLLIAFIVVVIGGMGNIPGTLLAGLGFGVVQVVGGANYGLVIAYVAMLIALAIRPGRKGGRPWKRWRKPPNARNETRSDAQAHAQPELRAQACADAQPESRAQAKTQSNTQSKPKADAHVSPKPESQHSPKLPTFGNRSLRMLLALLIPGVVLFILGASGALPTNAMRYLLQIFLYIALGEAWNLLSSFAGMTSLGQQLYVGIAGYAVAVMTSLYSQSLLIGVLVGVAASVVVALLLSQIFFRMEGMYLAIATWVAAEAMEKIFLNWDYVGQGSGMNVQLTPYPSITELYLLALIVGLASLVLVCVVLRSKLGLGLMAMRDDPSAAATIGISIKRSRLVVYLLAAVLCALAGAVFFTNKGTIYPDSGFSIGWTVSIIFVCIIGGSGTVLGPVAGSILYVLLREFLAHFPGWSNIMLGVITLLVILFMPKGIIGTLQSKLGFDPFSPRRDPGANRQKDE